jgi:hypothetical protein
MPKFTNREEAANLYIIVIHGCLHRSVAEFAANRDTINVITWLPKNKGF